MLLGEVCLFTDNVRRLANFYKAVLDTQNGSEDEIHQCVLSQGTALCILKDTRPREGNTQNICIAFDVEDVDAEYQRLTAMGISISGKPATQEWGARNMSFEDPDGNLVFFRCRCPS